MMPKDIEITLLSKEDIYGSNQLEVLEKYGLQAAMTDLTILTGCLVEERLSNVPDDDTLKGRSSIWWTKSSDGDGDIIVVDEEYNKDSYGETFYRCFSIRPVLKPK